MDLALAERIVNAVLYEGYMLYPYRPSSVKNRQRWTFGGVYPCGWSKAQGGTDPWTVQTECLVEGVDPLLDITVRFLHLTARQVCAVDEFAPAGRAVEALWVEGKLYQTWQEAVERTIKVPIRRAASLDVPVRLAFDFAGGRTTEALRTASGDHVAVLEREQFPIAGAVEIAARPVHDGLFRLTVRVMNLGDQSAVTGVDNAMAQRSPRDLALMQSLVSTHTLLGVEEGAWVSAIDPPEQYRAAVAACHNVGTWPVLIGETGARDGMLSSPIILYDYPEIAPESPGDLFDGTEIDEILTLRILTMTDDEKHEMQAVDERARALLQRTEALDGAAMMRLHGTNRGLHRHGDSQ